MTDQDTASGSPPRKRRTRQSPTVRRQDLLAVTVSCLARLGPRGTTGREICRQAGVSHGLIRHYFRNPDNLLLETYEQLCEQMLASLEGKIAEAEHDPWDALHNFFVGVFSDEWSNPDIIGAWMVFWQLVRSRADFRQVSDDFNQRQRALLERVARRFPERPDGQPLADSIAILSATMDGLWIDFYLSQDRAPPERCVALCDQTARRLFGA